MQLLKEVFYSLLAKHTSDTEVCDALWEEIVICHSEKHRFYHTLNHLQNIYDHLLVLKTEIEDWDTVLFTLFYHDIIYNASKSNNEEKSAELAEDRLNLIGYPNIASCVSQILASKTHQSIQDKDTDIFNDADLSILGGSWEEYSTYFSNVRKEYSIYPDFLYRKGRKKVLKHFLEHKSIFKTSYFRDRYESQAQHNLSKEISIL